jgi:hypothetical protein
MIVHDFVGYFVLRYVLIDVSGCADLSMYLCAVDFSDDCHDHAIVAVIEAMLPS